MKNIFFNEWKGFLRNRIFISLSIIFFISVSLVTYFGTTQNNKQILSQQEAKKHVREQWDNMDPSNPHSAAHYGTYAFKPSTILNSLDDGINSVTGVVLRLEGHKQNDVSFSEASQSLTISKFGKFKVSLLFQFIIPLFLIFLSFSTYTSEIHNNRIKLLIIQGTNLSKVIFGKIFSLLSLGFILLTFTIIIQFFFNLSSINFDQILRLATFFLSYLFYYFIVIAFTVLLSMIFRNSTSALSMTIISWLLWTIFLPKTIGNITEDISPLSTRFDLNQKMNDDRSKGIDGHNPFDEKITQLESEILEKYNVDSISELPINFSGVLMQADEEYGNEVWDKHYGELYNILQQQKLYYQLSGLVNPFASLQSLSMASSGTDLLHHLDFLKKAEKYRRYFVKSLNDELAYGGSRTGDRGWTASSEFFRSINDFNYNENPFHLIINKYYLDIFFLFLWTSVLSFLLLYYSKKVLIL